MTAAEQRAGRVSPRTLKLTVLRLALWTLVAAGPLVAAAVWARVDVVNQQLGSISADAAARFGSTSEVEGVAELALADFLNRSGDSESTPALIETISLGAEELDTGYYAVTIATITAGGQATSFHFYVLGVVSTPAGSAVVGPPALVGGPPSVDARDLAVSGLSRLGTVPGLSEAVDGFLAALLVGDGDVTRYIAPGMSLAPVRPPPFATIEVTEAGSVSRSPGDRMVVVTVEGVRSDGGSEVLQYSMVVAERGGRWEVTELLPAPPLQLLDVRGEG